MRNLIIDTVEVIADERISEEEVKAYVKYVKEKSPKKTLSSLTITIPEDDENDVNLEWVFDATPFERIRRITGYLVGTMDKWNNGKRAEEADRVKHGTNSGMEQL